MNRYLSQRTRRRRRILADVIDLSILVLACVCGCAAVFLLCILVMGWH